MKKFLLAFALLIGVASFYNTSDAQNINISINIGRQPAWGPVGYDYVDYYYMPDINCYFNVNSGLFFYFDRGRWISARYLPYAYRNYDLYGMHKVVLVNVANPWRYNHIHCRDYGRYKGHHSQVIIRDSRDNRYRDSRNNRVVWYSGNKHNNYRGNEYKYNGRDNDRYNYNKKDNNRKDYNYNGREQSRNNDRNLNNGRNNNKEQRYDNRQTERTNNNNISSRPSSSRETRKESNVKRSSSEERGNYRLASNRERATRSR